jgi:hypothetical protein
VITVKWNVWGWGLGLREEINLPNPEKTVSFAATFFRKFPSKERMKRGDRASLVSAVLKTRPPSSPTKFSFISPSDVLFLAMDQTLSKQTLFHANITDTNPIPKWNLVVHMPSESGTLSKEEQLLRERMRMVAVGVTNYILNST